MVCEVSGTLQGHLLGALGDIGRASLDREKINNTLDLVASQKEKQICFVKIQQLSPLQIRWNWGQSRLGKGKILVGLERHIYDYSHKRKPLTKQQWRHLELSARLLWSSKRYFVAKLYVFSIEYIAQILLEEKYEEFFLTKTGLVGVIEKSGK